MANDINELHWWKGRLTAPRTNRGSVRPAGKPGTQGPVLRIGRRASGPRRARLLEDLGAVLNALGGVFSTPQWGGRAYKLPRRGGARERPRLVAFVGPSRDGRAVTVS